MQRDAAFEKTLMSLTPSLTANADPAPSSRWGVLAGLGTLMLLTIIGVKLFNGVYLNAETAVSAAAPEVTVPAAILLDNAPTMAIGAVEQTQGAYIQMQDGVARFYFASGQASLPPGTEEALNHMVSLAQNRKKKLALGRPHSSFNESGNPSLQSLNQERLQSMQTAIRDLGLSAARVQIASVSVEVDAAIDTSRTHIDVWIMD